MSKVDINFSDYKASGVYFVEIDNSIIESVDSTSGRLAVGFSKNGPFNAPVYIDNTNDLAAVYGDIDTKLERKGVFFTRSLNILISTSSVYALNLLPVDPQGDLTSIMELGVTPKSGNIISTVPYASLYDKSRFWKPSTDNLDLATRDEYGLAHAINFGNVGTKDFTLFVRKAEGINGYSVTARDWYGTDADIPYSWIQPSDYMSDYFIQVICLEGKWDDKKLATDTFWSTYFELSKDGYTSVLKKDKVGKFLKLDTVNVIGNWTGCILPNFYNKIGQLQSIQNIINSYTTKTGLLMSVNEEALESTVVDLVGHTARPYSECVFMSYDFVYPTDMVRQLDGSLKVEGNSIIFYEDSSLFNELSVGTMVGLYNSGDEEADHDSITRIIKKQKLGYDSSVYGIIKTYGLLEESSDTIKIVPTIPDLYENLRPIYVTGFDIDAKTERLFDKNDAYYEKNGWSYYGEDVPIAKIYGMLEDKGIRRGLLNNDVMNFRYIIDTMAHGLGEGLGSKKFLSKLAQDKLSCLAFISAPSVKEFSTNGYTAFYDEDDPYKTFDTKYIPMGGNDNLIKSFDFSLMDEDSGSKHAAVFSPFLVYSSESRDILVPPAADVANSYMRKFNGGDPYVTVANSDGLLINARINAVEYPYDETDRGYLEPMGINPIIWRNGKAIIYGDRTAFQTYVSDYNYIHVRELLNTIEIESRSVLQGYVFKYNNAQTRSEITNKLTPILESMKNSGALVKYTFQFDENNNPDSVIDRSFAIIDIGVWITKNAEKIIARITVNKLSED